jgi:hypothetical protein
LQFIGKTPEELLGQRQQDILNQDIKTQRRIESQFLAFIANNKQWFKKQSKQKSDNCFNAVFSNPQDNVDVEDILDL